MKQNGRDILYTHFQIDLSETDFKIKKDFSEWLKNVRDSTKILSIEQRGSRSAVDVLRSLGMTRLLRVMPWDEVAKLFLVPAGHQNADSNKNKYQDKASWDKARDRTAKTIQIFSENFYGDIQRITNRTAAS